MTVGRNCIKHKRNPLNIYSHVRNLENVSVEAEIIIQALFNDLEEENAKRECIKMVLRKNTHHLFLHPS